LGYERRTTEDLRKKLADFFKLDVDDLFPAEMIGNEPREKYLEKLKVKRGDGPPISKK